MQSSDRVEFTINGEKFSVGSELSVTTSLNEFIRTYAGYHGTKFMCLEGGCGTCIVNASKTDPQTGEVSNFAVNSCLVKALTCNGWEIETVEGIGNRKIGYNVVQERLNTFFGSQCGYCSPGMVMSMYSLLKSKNGKVTEEDVENSFGSNLCRCTGYRPILEAFKSLAVKPDSKILRKLKDIEDLYDTKCLKSKQNGSCESLCSIEDKEFCMLNLAPKKVAEFQPKKITSKDGIVWYSVDKISSIFKVLSEEGTDSYMFLAGSTAQGIERVIFYPRVIIDISNVEKLKTHYVSKKLVLGANMTLNDTIEVFQELSTNTTEYKHLSAVVDHLLLVAHIPVRNIGTLAGNLATKNKYPGFQSDVFTTFSTVGATVQIRDANKEQMEFDLVDLLTTDLKGKLMTKIIIPPLSSDYKVVTYKVSPKIQNAHAQVNAGFNFRFDPSTNFIKSARIVYGGITPMFSRAYETEKLLIGRNVFSNSVIQMAIKSLETELNPDDTPPDYSPQFRKKLALGLFYKCIIKICPGNILLPIYKSGATIIDRPTITTSVQEYETNKSNYPLTEPVLKKEGIIQCAGEAIYSDDIPKVQDEVYAAFVLSTAKGTVDAIDASDALKLYGVLAVFTAKDIPGVNSFTFLGGIFEDYEELFAEKEVKFLHQPVALVVAKSQLLAYNAATLVKVSYSNVSTKAIITLEDAQNAADASERIRTYPPVAPTAKGNDTTIVIKGKLNTPRQYFHTMELQAATAIPKEDHLDIEISSQYPDITKSVVGQLLGISENYVRITTRRCGGAFGGKIGRPGIVACATALVAFTLNRVCRMTMDLRDTMKVVGKRTATFGTYEVGVNNEGIIQYMDLQQYNNAGYTHNESDNPLTLNAMQGICYDRTRWNMVSHSFLTETPTNVLMRAPGNAAVTAIVEQMMDHIAHVTKLDPLKVRSLNLSEKSSTAFGKMLPDFFDKTEFEQRKKEVLKFNLENRWKKRGIRYTNMAFPIDHFGNRTVLVSINYQDGSVVISTGGIEMGQGMFTMLCQTAAYELGIDISKISVGPSETQAVPNSNTTASSVGTESCVYAVIQACTQLKTTLSSLRESMPNATWEELVLAANTQGLMLQALFLNKPGDPDFVDYTAYSMAVVEIELDILTGRFWVVRTDIMQDAGTSINPAISVGQVEGAFIQGLSLWTLEDLKYNDQTGQLYTDRTWNYHIIGAKDIPHDFRVYLVSNTGTTAGVKGSKSISEAPLCLSHAVIPAVRDAINASRQDSGYDNSEFLILDLPITPEVILNALNVKTEEFVLY